MNYGKNLLFMGYFLVVCVFVYFSTPNMPEDLRSVCLIISSGFILLLLKGD